MQRWSEWSEEKNWIPDFSHEEIDLQKTEFFTLMKVEMVHQPEELKLKEVNEGKIIG